MGITKLAQNGFLSQSKGLFLLPRNLFWCKKLFDYVFAEVSKASGSVGKFETIIKG